MTLRYLSVCSGIEAATVAWHPLGWQAVAYSEIEAFPSAVLAHHYPNVPNYGDMTRFQEWPDAAIDVLVGGTPCQSFSVAGLRRGMADPRGNLALVYLALADRYRPQWLVWENVPGVLSSNGGRDFGSFLGGMAELGYGFAYRVLDAQHFGLAQRRKRVFVVGCLGDWRRAAAVLFEPSSLRGDPAPRRETRKGTPGGAARSVAIRGRDGTPQAELGDEVANAILTPNGGRAGVGVGAVLAGIPELLCAATGQAGAEIGADMAPTLTCNHEAPYIAHALRAEGFDASEDGSGRGTPLVPVAFTPSSIGDYREGLGTLRANGGDIGGGSESPIAFTAKDHGADAGAISPTLRGGGHHNSHANGGVMPAVAFAQNQRDEVRLMDVAGALASEPGMKQQTYVHTSAVRRLTPRECERLQGMADDVTNVPWRGKGTSPDGPRYKAIGNSWALNCIEWIGERMLIVDAWECTG